MNTFGDQLLKGAAGLEFAGELIDLPDIEGPAAPDSTAPARSSSSAWDDEVTWCTQDDAVHSIACLLYTSPSPRDRQKSRMPSSA